MAKKAEDAKTAEAGFLAYLVVIGLLQEPGPATVAAALLEGREREGKSRLQLAGLTESREEGKSRRHQLAGLTESREEVLEASGHREAFFS